MDPDVAEPFWNQIIRALRQISHVYTSVIIHCSKLCQEKICLICETGLLFRKFPLARQTFVFFFL